MTAVRTPKHGHILHHPQYRHRHLPEHGDPLDGILERDILRRRHDDRPVQLDLLRDGQLRVARSRRQIQDQHVQAAPVDFVQELLERFHDHEAAPGDGGFFSGAADEVAH